MKFVLIFFSLLSFNLLADDQELCRNSLEKYYSKNLDELNSISKEKRSRVESKIYKRIIDEKEWLEEQNSNFSYYNQIDDFTGDGTYRTNFRPTYSYMKSFCSKGKFRKGILDTGGAEDSRWMIRKVCRSGNCSPIQIYVTGEFNRFRTEDPTSYYYGINRVFAKDIGDFSHTSIDLDLEFDSSSNAIYTFHLGLNLTEQQFEKILDIGKDVSIRIYSNSLYSSSSNYMTLNFPIGMFKVFNTGINSN
tara:strand:- start:443 stop:1186 length:744 start_codon:yes stop_codon:yes gene_type:complete